MFLKNFFSNEPNPEMRQLLAEMIPPEVGPVSPEALDLASSPRAEGMMEVLGFGKVSIMDAIMSGETTMMAVRHGRQTSVVFSSDMWGKLFVTTYVSGSFPEFEIKSKDKNWQNQTLPPGILDAIRELGGLGKDMQIAGNGEGIGIQRKRSSKEAAGQNGNIQWLRDLQMAERLADGLLA